MVEQTQNTQDRIICSGALIISKDTHRFLLVQKSNGKNHGKWGLVGGTNLEGESAWQGLTREIQEEIGFMPDFKKTIPLEKFVSQDSLFNFHTYLCIIDKEFIPALSSEHIGWGWFDIAYPPKPVHRGLDLSLRNKTIQTKIQTVIDIIDSL